MTVNAKFGGSVGRRRVNNKKIKSNYLCMHLYVVHRKLVKSVASFLYSISTPLASNLKNSFLSEHIRVSNEVRKQCPINKSGTHIFLRSNARIHGKRFLFSINPTPQCFCCVTVESIRVWRKNNACLQYKDYKEQHIVR